MTRGEAPIALRDAVRDELSKERKSAHSALAGVAFGPEEACKYVYRATDAAIRALKSETKP